MDKPQASGAAAASQWRPDFATLRLFVAVCEEASIARAAEREAIVASAISKRISEIENAAGVELLVRGGRGVKPTDAGLAFLHHARHILLSAEKLQAELAEYAGGVRGHVRVLANISSIMEFLPADISRFLAQNAHIRVDLQERVSTEVVDGVRDGAADVGICLGNVDAEGLQLLPYARDELMLIAHADHPLASRKSVSFDDVAAYNLVGLQPGSRMTTFLAGLAARRNRTLNYRMYVSTYEAACHVIAQNLAVGILAARAVSIPRVALGLRAIRLDEDWAQREIVLCVRDLDALPPSAKALVGHLRDSGAAR